jgi:hypothetical protein
LSGPIVKPGIRQKDGEQAKYDRKADHDDGAGTHAGPLSDAENLLFVAGNLARRWY